MHNGGKLQKKSSKRKYANRLEIKNFAKRKIQKKKWFARNNK
jgi:hypothetical protein